MLSQKAHGAEQILKGISHRSRVRVFCGKSFADLDVKKYLRLPVRFFLGKSDSNGPFGVKGCRALH